MSTWWGQGLAVGAGLAGAAGVALAAVAAHKLQLPALASAASMLQIHAVGVLAVAAVALSVERPVAWLVAGSVMLFGAVLFAATLSLPAFGVFVLPGRVAPVGGSLAILGWVLVSVAAVLSFRRS